MFAKEDLRHACALLTLLAVPFAPVAGQHKPYRGKTAHLRNGTYAYTAGLDRTLSVVFPRLESTAVYAGKYDDRIIFPAPSYGNVDCAPPESKEEKRQITLAWEHLGKIRTGLIAAPHTRHVSDAEIESNLARLAANVAALQGFAGAKGCNVVNIHNNYAE